MPISFLQTRVNTQNSLQTTTKYMDSRTPGIYLNNLCKLNFPTPTFSYYSFSLSPDSTHIWILAESYANHKVLKITVKLWEIYMIRSRRRRYWESRRGRWWWCGCRWAEIIQWLIVLPASVCNKVGIVHWRDQWNWLGATRKCVTKVVYESL